MANLGSIRDPNVTLQQYYTLRDDLLTGKVQSYTIGDRTITLLDMDVLDQLIRRYEMAVASSQAAYADMSWPVHQPPFPEG